MTHKTGQNQTKNKIQKEGQTERITTKANRSTQQTERLKKKANSKQKKKTETKKESEK